MEDSASQCKKQRVFFKNSTIQPIWQPRSIWIYWLQPGKTCFNRFCCKKWWPCLAELEGRGNIPGPEHTYLPPPAATRDFWGDEILINRVCSKWLDAHHTRLPEPLQKGWKFSKHRIWAIALTPQTSRCFGAGQPEWACWQWGHCRKIFDTKIHNNESDIDQLRPANPYSVGK